VAPIDAVAAALEATGAVLQQHRDFACKRQAVIDANPALRERELSKLASLTSTLTEALRRRGVTDVAACLAAEAGTAVFKTAFERWIADTDRQDLPQLIRESFDQLKVVTAGA
jgi:hypothetical protein